MANKQKLELTWIGKGDQPKLEPRILIEDQTKSYGDKNAENMMIYGDNLLALKALEQDFAGKIKCIYIDPPFNTKQAFEFYEDSIEHSLWLSLIDSRLKSLLILLDKAGSIFIHIDDNELGYLISLADEVFGRNNRIAIITFKQGSPTGHKAINPGCISTTNFVLWYCRNRDYWQPNRIYTERERNDRYNQYIVNRDCHFNEWRLIPLTQAFALSLGIDPKKIKKVLTDYEDKLTEFVLANTESVVQLARPNYQGVSRDAKMLIDESKQYPEKIFHLAREGYSDMYFMRGERIIFFRDTLKEIDGKLVPGEPLTTLWDDIPSHNLHNEGDVDFPKGKKPEALIKRCIELTTNPGDIVLDSFAGSGTTGAVAHKMGRKWIMVELGDHCHTHCMPRLQSVCNGIDQSGISKEENWKGGGGFKYYYLAPSLLKQDSRGNWIISEEYNAAQLAAAMAKQEGFRFMPDETFYWKQGKSTEKDFIFTTTNFVSVEFMDTIHDEMKEDESLLICCTSFSKAADKYPSITIKKIPKMLLGRCEFGKEDYSLNIVNLPRENDEPNFVPTGPIAANTVKTKKKKESATVDLFSSGNGGKK